MQSGDVIPYIMCEVDTSQPNALRAFHPDEVSKQEGLKVDKSYYLQHQVHAVVSRLCDPIPGLDPSQIALWLGLDPSHYRWKGGEVGEEDALEAVVVDTQEKFKNCKPLSVLCPHCNKPVEFKEVLYYRHAAIASHHLLSSKHVVWFALIVPSLCLVPE